MRSRSSSHSQAAEVARRRLELLGAELAGLRPGTVDPPSPTAAAGPGELTFPLDASAAREPFEPPGHSEPPGPFEPPGRRSPGAPGRHARRAGGWLEDRLPGPLQGRVRIGPSQLTVVAVIVAAGLGLLAWWSVRAADPGELVPTAAPRAPLAPGGTTGGTTGGTPGGPPGSAHGPAPPTGPPPTGRATATRSLVVDVAGKVRRPGIVRLPAGSRVVDALDEAGGARRGVDLTGLNLARPLVDGEQVLVGVPPVPGVAPGAAAGPPEPGTGPAAGPVALVPLNTATAADLDTLPGVGPVTAAAILQWRDEHGAFSAVEELLEVSGIGEVTLAELAPFVTL